MCRINRTLDGETPPHFPTPRSVPHLAWAMPVDIITLATNLESYSDQVEEIHTLRLCHRFGSGPLQRLPQEILDHIVRHIHQIDLPYLRCEWKDDYNCFLGKCGVFDHLVPGAEATEDLWRDIFREDVTGTRGDILDPDDFTEDERAEMLWDEYLGGEGEDVIEFTLQHLHRVVQQAWVRRCCCCDTDNFGALNKILKSHFGLEAVILHEQLSREFRAFLPYDVDEPVFIPHYTSCYLTPALPEKAEDTSDSTPISQGNKNFMQGNENSLGFHQVVDPAKLSVSAEQKLRFAKAMRVLNVRPQYHLTEMQSRLNPGNTESAFWAICQEKVKGCPKPSKELRSKKLNRLKSYLKSKNSELAKQDWPQLMLLAASDLVTPDGCVAHFHLH